MPSTEVCGCGWHLITNEMTPTTPANAETRARFQAGAKRTRELQRKMFAAGAVLTVAMIGLTIYLVLALGEAALMVPIFFAAVVFRVYRAMLTREMFKG